MSKKTYVLTVSKHFPQTHKRSGEYTGFVENIRQLFSGNCKKIHTIRSNYELWRKRAEEINSGRAVLSIRYWSEKPYRSKQVEICRLEKIGLEKLYFEKVGDYQMPRLTDLTTLAKNDGLSIQDFKDWFKGYDLSKPMAIIHFTDFRYENTK